MAGLTTSDRATSRRREAPAHTTTTLRQDGPASKHLDVAERWIRTWLGGGGDAQLAYDEFQVLAEEEP